MEYSVFLILGCAVSIEAIKIGIITDKFITGNQDTMLTDINNIPELPPEVDLYIQPFDAMFNLTIDGSEIERNTTGFIVVASCQNIHQLNNLTVNLLLPVFLIPTSPCISTPFLPNAYIIQIPGLQMYQALTDILKSSRFAKLGVIYDNFYDYKVVSGLFNVMADNYMTAITFKINKNNNDVELREWFQNIINATNCFILLMAPELIPTVLLQLKFQDAYKIITIPEMNSDVFTNLEKHLNNTVIVSEWIVESNTEGTMTKLTEDKLVKSIKLISEVYSQDDSDQDNRESSIQKMDGYFDANRHILDREVFISRLPMITKPIGSWSSSSGLLLNTTDLFYQEVPGFGNMTLIIGTNEAPPFIIKNTNGVYKGFCIDILNELAYRLKFRYIIREPGDGQWGAPNADGTWNGLVRQTMEKNFDMSIGPISLTSEREEVIDFTTPIMEDGAGIIVRKFEDTYGKMFRSFKPFTYNVWLTIGGVLLAVGLVLGLVDKMSPYRGKTYDTEPGKKKSSIADDIWIVFGSYMEQGAEFTPSNASGRFILGFWWIFTILIIASYTASLAAFLTVAFFDKPIKTVDDLADQTEIIPLVKQGSNLYTLLENGETERYRKLFKLVLQAPKIYSHEEAIQLVRTGSYAYLTDQSQLEFLRNADCEQLILAEEAFNVVGMGFIVPEDSPLMNQLSFSIIKLQEAGLINKWRQKWWTTSETCTEEKPTSVVKALELETTSGPFIVFGGTTFLSMVCLVLEHVYFRYRGSNYENTQRRNTISTVNNISCTVPNNLE